MKIEEKDTLMKDKYDIDMYILCVQIEDEEIAEWLPLKELFSFIKFMCKDSGEVVRKSLVRGACTRIKNKALKKVGRKKEFTFTDALGKDLDYRMVMINEHAVENYIKESLKIFRDYNMIGYGSKEKHHQRRKRWHKSGTYTYQTIKLTKKGESVK